MTYSTSTRHGAVFTVWAWVLCSHALVVLALLVLFVVMQTTAPPNSGANIGAGLVGLPLMALGHPWTLIVFGAFFDPSGPFGVVVAVLNRLGPVAAYAVRLAPAPINVVIHAALYGWARRRLTRR